MKTRFVENGESILKVEVTNVSPFGFWLLVGETERYVPFEHFPWFREASIGQIFNVEMQSADHLYWPELDIDLSIESIDHPDRFPLVSKVVPAVDERVIV